MTNKMLQMRKLTYDLHSGQKRTWQLLHQVPLTLRQHLLLCSSSDDKNHGLSPQDSVLMKRATIVDQNPPLSDCMFLAKISAILWSPAKEKKKV